MMHAVRCPICSQTMEHIAYPVRDLILQTPGSWSYLCCHGCDHGVLSPQPEEEELGRFYGGLYTPENLATMQGVDESRMEQQLRSLRRRVLDPLLEVDPQQILDLGCGLGGALEALRERFPDAEITGVELAEPAAARAEARGFRVLRSSVTELKLEPESIDLIAAHHLLEHLRDPRDFVERASRLLRSGGRLMVEVPHFGQGNWVRRVLGRWYWPHLPPQHLQGFSPESLRELLEQCGLEPESSYQARYPLPWITAWVLYCRFTFGSASPHAQRWWLRGPLAALGLIALLPLLLLELITPLLLLSSQGEIVGWVAKKTESTEA